MLRRATCEGEDMFSMMILGFCTGVDKLFTSEFFLLAWLVLEAFALGRTRTACSNLHGLAPYLPACLPAFEESNIKPIYDMVFSKSAQLWQVPHLGLAGQ